MVNEETECWLPDDRYTTPCETWLKREVSRLTDGPLPNKAHVRNRCGNPYCSRPDHLFRVEPRSLGESAVSLVSGAEQVLRGVQMILSLPEREGTHEAEEGAASHQ